MRNYLGLLEAIKNRLLPIVLLFFSQLNFAQISNYSYASNGQYVTHTIIATGPSSIQCGSTYNFTAKTEIIDISQAGSPGNEITSCVSTYNWYLLKGTSSNPFPSNWMNDPSTHINNTTNSVNIAIPYASGTYTVMVVAYGFSSGTPACVYATNNKASTGSSFSATYNDIVYIPPIAGNTICCDQAFCNSGNPSPIGQKSGVILSGGSSPYVYQWQSSANGTSGWANISGATSSSYDPPVISATVFYRRMVTSGSLQNPSNSAKVTVDINQTPSDIISHGYDNFNLYIDALPIDLDKVGTSCTWTGPGVSSPKTFIACNAGIGSKTLTASRSFNVGTSCPVSNITSNITFNIIPVVNNMKSISGITWVKDVPAYHIGTGDFTIESWINLNYSNSESPIVCNTDDKNIGFCFGVDNGSKLYITIAKTKLYSNLFSSILGTGNHHIAVSRQSGVVTFFLDGQSIGSGVHNGSISGSYTPYHDSYYDLNFGYDYYNSLWSNGYIDEVRFWNKNRTQSEINIYKKWVLNQDTPGLIGYWGFNDGGQVGYDASMTRNDIVGYVNASISAQGESLLESRSSYQLFSPDNSYNGLAFTGNQRATIPYVPAYDLGTGNFSIEVGIMVGFGATTTKSTLISNMHANNPNGFELSIKNNYTQISLNIGGTVFNSAIFSTLTDNPGCQFVKVKRTNGVVTFYINNYALSSFNNSTSISNVNQSILLGYLDAPTPNSCDCQIISANIANAMYYVGYWYLDETTNYQILVDNSVVHNNGYLGSSILSETIDPIKKSDQCSSDRRANSEDVIRSVEEVGSAEISVYPNPFVSEIIINTGLSAEVSYKITDLGGRQICSGVAFNQQVVTLPSMNSGIYLLQIEDPVAGTKNFKISRK